MATPTPDELKERASSDLKRVTETANAATKTALLSFSALAVIWFSQIHPQNKQLLEDVYPELTSDKYTQITSQRRELRETREDLKDRTKPTGSGPGAVPTSASVTTVPPAEDTSNLPATAKPQLRAQQTRTDLENRVKSISHLQANATTTSQQVQRTQADLESRVKSISFKVFGLELPVPPLWASVVWNVLLLGVLLYLARARVVVWRLCANALSNLKQLGRTAVDEIAGTGAMWIAPSPSRPGTSDYPTVRDLRNAFGWNRLQTLPSMAATVGFLLLILLQLTVTFEGLSTLKEAEHFTNWVMTAPDLGATKSLNPKDFNDSSILKDRVWSLAEIYHPPADNTRARSPYLFRVALMQLAVTPSQSSFIAGFLILMTGGMFVLITWWFWPWSVPGRQTDEGSVTQLLAVRVLIFFVGVSLFLFLSWAFPVPTWTVGHRVYQLLPAVIRFIAVSVASFCLIELVLLALSPIREDQAGNP